MASLYKKQVTFKDILRVMENDDPAYLAAQKDQFSK